LLEGWRRLGACVVVGGLVGREAKGGAMTATRAGAREVREGEEGEGSREVVQLDLLEYLEGLDDDE